MKERQDSEKVFEDSFSAGLVDRRAGGKQFD